MFDPKQITSSMLGYAPQFVLARFSSVIMGVIIAYGVLLTFLGHPPFFQRVGELGLIMTACYWSARAVRYALMRITLVLDPAAVSVPPPAPSAPASGSASDAGLAVKAAPKPAASPVAAGKETRGLD